MARLKFFLHQPKSKQETPIYLSVTYSGNRIKLKTKQKIKSKAWNPKSNSVRVNRTEYSDLQIELNRIERIVKQKIDKLINDFGYLPAKSDLKNILESEVFSEEKSLVNATFWEFFEKHKEQLPTKISYKTGKPISNGVIQAYNQLYNVIKDYENDTGETITFLTLNNQTYNSLIEYFKTVKKFTPNTIGKHIKNFKALIKEAKEGEGITISEKYNRNFWKVIKENKNPDEIVFLNENELKDLYDLELELGSIQDKSRDIFLVGAWTALRISDIVNLSVDNIQDYGDGKKIIHIHTQKSDKQVSISYHPIIGEILNKYGGNMPKVSEPRINKIIKDVCSNIKSLKNKTVTVKVTRGGITDFKTYKRYEKVTTHTARKSFASNMYKRNVSVRQIMAVTGHVKEADFFRYIGVSDKEQVETLNENFRNWF